MDILNLIKENIDNDMLELVVDDIDGLKENLNSVELELLLNSPYDKCDCIL